MCRWGTERLVVVASQRLRHLALCGRDKCDVVELNDTQYCFLEMVGRYVAALAVVLQLAHYLVPVSVVTVQIMVTLLGGSTLEKVIPVASILIPGGRSLRPVKNRGEVLIRL